MRVILGCAVVLIGLGAAHAQPAPQPYPPPQQQPYGPPPQQQPYGPPPQQQPYGPPPQQQPYGPPPQQQPYGPPQPYAPSPYGYQPQPQLTADEQELLASGYISDGQLFAGVALNLFVGFGTGQAAQGRWHDTGWIFTLGQTASTVALFAGMIDAIAGCADAPNGSTCNKGEGLLVGGLVGFTVFYVWGIADTAIAPSRHNAQVRELRMRVGLPPEQTVKLMPYVAPTHAGEGGVAGVTLRF